MITNNKSFYVSSEVSNGFLEEELKRAFGIQTFNCNGGFISPYRYPKVKKVIYNFKNPYKPATIVFFDDGSKVVVKCDVRDFTKEGGLAQAYLKKILGTRGNIKKLIESADIQE